MNVTSRPVWLSGSQPQDALRALLDPETAPNGTLLDTNGKPFFIWYYMSNFSQKLNTFPITDDMAAGGPLDIPQRYAIWQLDKAAPGLGIERNVLIEWIEYRLEIPKLSIMEILHTGKQVGYLRGEEYYASLMSIIRENCQRSVGELRDALLQRREYYNDRQFWSVLVHEKLVGQVTDFYKNVILNPRGELGIEAEVYKVVVEDTKRGGKRVSIEGDPAKCLRRVLRDGEVVGIKNAEKTASGWIQRSMAKLTLLPSKCIVVYDKKALKCVMLEKTAVLATKAADGISQEEIDEWEQATRQGSRGGPGRWLTMDDFEYLVKQHLAQD